MADKKSRTVYFHLRGGQSMRVALSTTDYDELVKSLKDLWQGELGDRLAFHDAQTDREHQIRMVAVDAIVIEPE